MLIAHPLRACPAGARQARHTCLVLLLQFGELVDQWAKEPVYCRQPLFIFIGLPLVAVAPLARQPGRCAPCRIVAADTATMAAACGRGIKPTCRRAR